MRSSALKPGFYFTRQSNLQTPKGNPPRLLSINPTSSLKKYLSESSPVFASSRTQIPTAKHIRRCSAETHHNHRKRKYHESESASHSQSVSKRETHQFLSGGYSRFVILGSVSIGFAIFLMGTDQHKALALGPEGPLMEEFWENVRRYGLYALTVSTGALYAVFQPILELLRNPISAILILIILGAGVFIVSQVLSAMVGVSDFSYDYSY